MIGFKDNGKTTDASFGPMRVRIFNKSLQGEAAFYDIFSTFQLPEDAILAQGVLHEDALKIYAVQQGYEYFKASLQNYRDDAKKAGFTLIDKPIVVPEKPVSHVVMLIHEENGVFGASFPDFPGAITGSNEYEAIYDKAREMLLFHTEGEPGDAIRAKIRTVRELKADPEFVEDFLDARVRILDIEFPD